MQSCSVEQQGTALLHAASVAVSSAKTQIREVSRRWRLCLPTVQPTAPTRIDHISSYLGGGTSKTIKADAGPFFQLAESAKRHENRPNEPKVLVFAQDFDRIFDTAALRPAVSPPIQETRAVIVS